MNRKKKKHRIKNILLLLIIIIAIIIVYLDEINEYFNINIIVNKYDIVNTSESDPEVIKKTFATGMNIKDIKDLFNKKEKYIKNTHKYTKLEYDFEEKLHYSEIEDLLLKLNNSDIVKLENIGSSVDNRNIYGIEVGKGKDVFFVDANIHAAEVGNTLILIKFLSELVNSYESGDKSIVNILNNVKIAVIPTINPDGYEIYNFGIESLNNKNLWLYKNKDDINFNYIKSNANGIDLNRNFPTQNAGTYYKNKQLMNMVSFEKTTNKNTYFGGKQLGSEPEVKATMYFMLKHYKNTYAYINMHSQGRVIYAGCPNLSNEFNELSRNYAKRIVSINNYTLFDIEAEEVGEGNDGGAADFMSELANGFKFSSITGKLSTNSYINNNASLVYKYSSITLETLTDWTTNPKYFKDEYYNYGIKEVLYDTIKVR
ncbi:MAG: hypothetical protein GX758_05055 [Tenericutes bacterium]|nr:hypothetical protein [Mycoplasmatota bacterium]